MILLRAKDIPPDLIDYFEPVQSEPRDTLNPKPSSYAGKHYACVDTETECLTIGGWKRYDQLREGMPIFTYNMEMQQLEIQPINAIAMYEYKGNLISVFGRNTNMVMTPNHRCVIQRRLHRQGGILGKPDFVRADELKLGHKFPVAAILPDDGLLEPNDPPEFFELLGWIITDGYFNDEGSVYIYQSMTKPEHVTRINQLSEFFGDEIAQTTRERNGTTEICYAIHGELRKRVRLFLPDRSEVPEHFLTLPSEYAKAFLDGIVGGDGHIRDDKRITIIQKYKGMLDMVQAMFLRTGRSCILSQRASKQWSAFVSNCTTRHFRNSKSSLVRNDYAYHGIVWCPQVENSTWVARRGGRPFITGNTYPPDLIRPLIKSSCPTRCCPACGAGWAPRIEKPDMSQRPTRSDEAKYPTNGNQYSDDGGGTSKSAGQAYQEWRNANPDQVIDYRPTCNCIRKWGEQQTADGPQTGAEWLRRLAETAEQLAPVPGIVLDPFVGSGTTLIEARNQGLRGIGLDLSYKYLKDQARARLELDAWDAWHQGRDGDVGEDLEGLPLFKGVG